MTTNSEPSVKCRHCGEVIHRCLDGCMTGAGWIHDLTGSHYGKHKSHIAIPEDSDESKSISTVLSAEDRERLEEAEESIRCFLQECSIPMPFRSLLEGVSERIQKVTTP